MAEQKPDEELLQLREVAKTMATPGWNHIMQMLGIERERQIKLAKNARTEARWDYYRGILWGFDGAVGVMDRLRLRIEEVAEESAQGEKDENRK